MAKSKIDEKRKPREWHPNYVDYTEKIVSNPVYEGLPFERGKNGRVKWVVTGNSEIGQKRLAWWNEKCKKLNIPIQKGCYAKAARLIHPTDTLVCQCCGKERSIYYEYPTIPTLKKLNKAFGIDLKQTDYTIREFVRKFCTSKELLNRLADLLKISRADSADELIDCIKTELIDKESSLFSPGAMCNPPDRFNGFHSYALCCRKNNDTGRYDENMDSYTQDRRAYEEWSDGDYNLANRLMGEFHKDKKLYRCPICGELKRVSADHIGPISLGFCHSIYNFAPLCSSCNSAKNNRFYKSDVDKLIEIENKGHIVVSWHSKHIWDTLKNDVRNNEDAKRLSKIMSINHQSVLQLLSIIYEKTDKDFLMRYLHPEYSLYDYRFKNFDPTDLSKLIVNGKKLNSKNKLKNQERYVRVAFESLGDFQQKDNRRTLINLDPYHTSIEDLIQLIISNRYDEADDYLRKLVDQIGEDLINAIWD